MASIVEISARRGSMELTASLSFQVGELCTVEIELSDGDRQHGEGADLFEALVAARRVLEMRGVSLACNGARRDVYPSPMLRQATQGRRAYVLSDRRSKQRPPSVDIFGPAEWSSVTTVELQHAAFIAWLGDPPPGRESLS